MKIHFLGVGEACDPKQLNTSILLKTNARETCGRILLDCGFSVPHCYLSLAPPPDELEIIWISHFHGDHFLGMPLLLLWFWEMSRTKPLIIMGPAGIKDTIEASLKLAYPNLLPRLEYSLEFYEVRPDTKLQIADATWHAALDDHSQPCLSLRIDINGKSLFYSGDGRPTSRTRILAEGCDVVIHEAYGNEDSIPGHGSILSSIEFARNAKAKRLALVHIQRNTRLQCMNLIHNCQEEFADIEILVPEQGSSILL